MVTSVNGSSLKGNKSPQFWASAEDHVHFQSVLNRFNLHVMGSTTYESSKKNIKHEKGRLRIVLTHSPQKYMNEEIPGQLEFTNESSSALIKESEQKGYQELLLLGGATINSLFFNEGLVDELWLTLEPSLFEGERGLIQNLSDDIDMELKSCEKLNSRGTLLLKYKILGK